YSIALLLKERGQALPQEDLVVHDQDDWLPRRRCGLRRHRTILWSAPPHGRGISIKPTHNCLQTACPRRVPRLDDQLTADARDLRPSNPHHHTTIVSCNMPRALRSRSRPAIGRSVARALSAWPVFRSACWSQRSPLVFGHSTSTKRTPRSTNRRASRQCRPKI